MHLILGVDRFPVSLLSAGRLRVVTALTVFVVAAASVAAQGAASPDEIGYASWYGTQFHGRLTASGQVYDMNKMTAAHKTLPFGTEVLVTNLANGKSVVVTINDRGPFVAGRIIDLSRAAAQAIGLTGMGVAKVRLHIIKLGANERVASSATVISTASASSVVLQVGAFRDLSNAVRLRDLLARNGFDPRYEKAGGITRILLTSVPRMAVTSVRQRLAKLGINSVLVRHE